MAKLRIPGHGVVHVDGAWPVESALRTSTARYSNAGFLPSSPVRRRGVPSEPINKSDSPAVQLVRISGGVAFSRARRSPTSRWRKEHGWLTSGTDGKATQKPRLEGLRPTRCYVSIPRFADGDD